MLCAMAAPKTVFKTIVIYGRAELLVSSNLAGDHSAETTLPQKDLFACSQQYSCGVISNTFTQQEVLLFRLSVLHQVKNYFNISLTVIYTQERIVANALQYHIP